jgi:hypothetical protein
LVGSSSNSRSEGHRLVHLRVAETQPGEQLAGAGIGRVTVGAVQLGMQPGQRDAIVGAFRDSQVMLNGAQGLITVEHIVHRHPLQGVDFLSHMRDAPVWRQVATAPIWRQLTPQQGKERGLASAIGADEPSLLAGVQSQLGVF